MSTADDAQLDAWIAEAAADLGADADADSVGELLMLRHGRAIASRAAIAEKLLLAGAQRLVEELQEAGVITPDMSAEQAADIAMREGRRRAKGASGGRWN